MPTTAVTTISASQTVATSISPSIPKLTFTSKSFTLSERILASASSHMATILGLNSRICFSSKSIFLCAESATTSTSLFILTISSVCVPMDPVDPKIDIFFIYLTQKIYCKKDCRSGEYHTVKSVKYATMSRNQISIVFYIMISLYS